MHKSQFFNIFFLYASHSKELFVCFVFFSCNKQKFYEFSSECTTHVSYIVPCQKKFCLFLFDIFLCRYYQFFYPCLLFSFSFFSFFFFVSLNFFLNFLNLFFKYFLKTYKKMQFFFGV